MYSRRNIFIRSVATATGDFSVGVAMAGACIWVINAAAFGFFLSFLMWLLAIVMSLALSQYVVHPAVSVLLSDRKLDQGIAVAADAVRTGAEVAKDLLIWAQQLRADLRPPAAAV